MKLEKSNMEQSTQLENIDFLYKDRYKILGIVLVGSLMALLDSTMVNITLPTITAHFNANLSQSQWIITSYLLAMTSLFIIFGKVSVYTGKAKLFIIGWIFFTLSSLACGLSTDINELIIFRLIQGIGASMVFSIYGALLYEAFPESERGRAMSYSMAIAALGTMIGPGLGGLITDNLGWQYIFLINVPIGIILLLFAFKYLKIHEITSENLEMEWIGAGTIILFVISLIMFCGELANGITVTLPLIVYGIVFLFSFLGFIFQESRCKKPLLDLSIFKNKLFALPIISSALYFMAFNILNILGPFYFHGFMGYNASQVGLLFMVTPLFVVVLAPLGGWLYDKRHWKHVTGLGLLIVVVSYIFLSYEFVMGNIELIIMAFVLGGIGGGIFTGPNNTEIMKALPIEKSGIASSVSATARNLGLTLGVSLASLILTLELNIVGYMGVSTSAGPSLLGNAIAVSMVVAGILCMVAMISSVWRNL